MNTCLYANDLDDYACAVYEQHWPDGTLQQEDIRLVTAEDVCRRGVPDLICGGFPCQDISCAGKGAGIVEGTRSGLWFEMVRLIGEIRPRYIVVENVAAILGNGLGIILGDLAALRYDAEWDIIPACAFGAPHIRERFFLVAYSEEVGCGDRREPGSGCAPTIGDQHVHQQTWRNQRRHPRVSGSRSSTHLPNTDRIGFTDTSTGLPTVPILGRRDESRRYLWNTEPALGRMVDGLPDGVDRLACLGNAIVPQVAQFVGECVMTHNGGEFTFAELFCGIGGFRLGFEWASGREVGT